MLAEFITRAPQAGVLQWSHVPAVPLGERLSSGTNRRLFAGLRRCSSLAMHST